MRYCGRPKTGQISAARPLTDGVNHRGTKMELQKKNVE